MSLAPASALSCLRASAPAALALLRLRSNSCSAASAVVSANLSAWSMLFLVWAPTSSGVANIIGLISWDGAFYEPQRSENAALQNQTHCIDLATSVKAFLIFF